MQMDTGEVYSALEIRKRARQIQVSTDDNEVMDNLRELREAICLFGEDAADRRERLRYVLASRKRTPGDTISGSHTSTGALGGSSASKSKQHQQDGAGKSTNENDGDVVWYHIGPSGLKQARIWMADDSLVRARDRLQRARAQNAAYTDAQRKAAGKEVQRRYKTLRSVVSESVDTRPLIYCAFGPSSFTTSSSSSSSYVIATAGMSGLIKIFDINKQTNHESVNGDGDENAQNGDSEVLQCEQRMALRGHQDRVNCVSWNPQASPSSSLTSSSDTSASASATVALASSDNRGEVRLWNLCSEEPLASVEGHEPHRVNRMAFSPSGRFLATSCWDRSWRLWDLSCCSEILHQEGHSRAVYDLQFHPDGSLMLSGGMDSYGRVWDLRTGHCIMFLEGHSDAILSVAWAPNGYSMASGSADNSVRLWDMRAQQCVYKLPAHNGVVSCVKWIPAPPPPPPSVQQQQQQDTPAHSQAKHFPDGSHVFMTTGYDKKLKLWSHPTWTQLKSTDEHDAKIMHGDASSDGEIIATVSYNRVMKLWSCPKVMAATSAMTTQNTPVAAMVH